MFGATMVEGLCFINDDVKSSSLNPWSRNNIEMCFTSISQYKSDSLMMC